MSDLTARARALLDELDRLSAWQVRMPDASRVNALLAFAAEVQAQQRQEPLTSQPVFMAGLAATLKAECEKQYLRAKTAEAKLAEVQAQGVQELASVNASFEAMHQTATKYLLELTAAQQEIARLTEQRADDAFERDLLS